MGQRLTTNGGKWNYRREGGQDGHANNVEFPVAKRGLQETKGKSAKKYRVKVECSAIAMVGGSWNLECLEGQ